MKETKVQKSNKGITLIALVVTIIVLLILAGVSIQMLTGQTGILSQARQAVKATKEGEIIEDIQLKLFDDQIDNQGIKKKSDLIILLSQYGTVKEENGKIKSIVLEDGTEIAIERIYTGEIIEDNATYIYTKEELEDFRNNVNLGKTYKNETIILMNDIDLKCDKNDKETYWVPIGDSNNTFSGIFNGNNKKITNLYIKETNADNNRIEVGFFGDATNATIKNITVAGEIQIDGINIGAGGILEIARGKVTLENCKNEINIISTCLTRGIGGILAVCGGEASDVSLKNCVNIGDLSAKERVGGILGYLAPSGKLSVENCSNQGTVEGVSTSGGCIGGCDLDFSESNGVYLSINRFNNTGNVISSESYAGGVIGNLPKYSKIYITNVKNTCESVKGNAMTGGFIGWSQGESLVIISNSYNSANVESDSYDSGGIMGDVDSNLYLINVINLGNCTTYKTTVDIINGSSGGIVASSYALTASVTIINSYNLGNINASKYASGILGGRKNSTKNIIIKNVYNAGILNGNDGEYGITYISEGNIDSDNIENVFYLDNIDNGINIQNDTSIKKTEAEMKLQEFTDKLNEYVDNNPSYTVGDITIKLLKWQLKENEYPTFL